MKNTIIAVDKTRSYRVYLTLTTLLTEEARSIYHTTPLAITALGRVLTVAGMMGLMLKGEKDKLVMQIKGDGPVGEILATADSQGRVKGYITNPDVDLPLKEDGNLDVGNAVGKGTLTIIRDMGLKQPYGGRINLVSGEIADDLEEYFLNSEQQPSSIALGVNLGIEGNVSAAWGVIIQALPGAQEECIESLEKAISKLELIASLVEPVESPSELLALIFEDMPDLYKPITLVKKTINWSCDCSRTRMESVLISMGRKSLASIIKKDKDIELKCQFCLKKYKFNEEELKKLLKEAKNA